MPYLSHRHLNRLLNEEYDRGQAIGFAEGRETEATLVKELVHAKTEEKAGFIDYRGQDLRREATGIAVALLPYSPNADPLTIAADVAKFLETGDTAPAGVQEAPLHHDENTLNKVRDVLSSKLFGAGTGADILINALLNAGILFRERPHSEPETTEVLLDDFHVAEDGSDSGPALGRAVEKVAGTRISDQEAWDAHLNRVGLGVPLDSDDFDAAGRPIDDPANELTRTEKLVGPDDIAAPRVMKDRPQA